MAQTAAHIVARLIASRPPFLATLLNLLVPIKAEPQQLITMLLQEMLLRAFLAAVYHLVGVRAGLHPLAL